MTLESVLREKLYRLTDVFKLPSAVTPIELIDDVFGQRIAIDVSGDLQG